MSGLRQRVLTAVVLVPAAVAAILWLPNLGFALVTGAVVLVGGWEWSRLAGWTDSVTRLAYLLGLAVVLLAAALLLQAGGLDVLLALGVAWWLLALGLVVRYQRTGRGLTPSPGLRALAGDLTLVPAWGALVALHGQEAHGPVWVLALAALVWLADIGAFFVGRRWGRRKLAVRVSPGKSWEGVAGGGLAALAGAVAAIVLAREPVDQVPVLIALVVVTVAASVLGDLTESLFKRDAGLKDSGGLLPGHGGVLDRIDSLLAAAPVFVLGLGWMGRLT